jgi:2-dehydropantoate 2-reductase
VNVYVVGAGAVGTYLGELLRATGSQVTYAPRDLAAVEPHPADLAIVAVKAYATEDAIRTLRRAQIGDGAVVLTPQNGVGNEELLAAAFGADRVCSGALTVPVERRDDGSIAAANRGGLGLAPVGRDALNWLAAAFGQTALPTTVFADYRAMKWSKLALNIIANAGCAILDVLPETLVSYTDVFALEIEAVREVRAVMNALRLQPVDLPRYPVRALFAASGLPAPVARALLGRRIAGARGRKPPSLLLDARTGKGRTEIDALSGAVARAAEHAGIAAPVNATFAKIADAVARDPDLRATYRENPSALVRAVAAERQRANPTRKAMA